MLFSDAHLTYWYQFDKQVYIGSMEYIYVLRTVLVYFTTTLIHLLNE